MSESSAPSSLPPVRRIITGHTKEGKSTILRDHIQAPSFWTPGSINAVHDICRSEEVPASNDSELKTGEWVDEISLKSIRQDPYFVASTLHRPFHRTISLDYGILAKRSMVLELDDGQRTVMHQGDVIVQRGAIHTWRNESDEWARMYFVLLGAKPVVIEGKALETEWQTKEN